MIWDLITTGSDTAPTTLLLTPEKTYLTNCTAQASLIPLICYILVDNANFHRIKGI
jgi:hypothetical protein